MFYNKVVEKYNQRRSAIISTYNHLKEYKENIKEIAYIDANMWHGKTGKFQYDMQYDYVRLFLMDRYNFLNTVFNKSHSEFLQLL